MFKCARCKEFSKPREKMNKVTIEQHPKVYIKITHNSDGEVIDQREEGTGLETVREIALCSSCNTSDFISKLA